MNNLTERAIRSLLFEHDYVTVPNLGAFIAHYVAAEFESDSQSFAPPVRKISFNGLLKQDDGLLTTYLSRKMNGGREEARQLVGNFVEGLKQQLTTNQQVALADIGFLSLSTENKIVFEPMANANFFAESFGLEKFYTWKQLRVQSDNPSLIVGLNLPMDVMEINYVKPTRQTSLWQKALFAFPIAVLSLGLTYLMLHNRPTEQEAVSSVNPLEHLSTFSRNWETPAEKPVENYNIISSSAENKYLTVAKFESIPTSIRAYNRLILNGYDATYRELEDGRIEVKVPFGASLATETKEKVEQLLGMKIVEE